MTHKLILSILCTLFVAALAAQNPDDLGRTEPFLIGFKGTIYNLVIPAGGINPRLMRYSPDIEKTDPIGYVYAQKLFITERELNTPFPGVPFGKTVFAIIYTGRFEIKESGIYEFLLQSDDGSRLWIDSTEVIERDGLRQFKLIKQGGIRLAAGFHDIKVWYFQGFPDRMGLILMYKRTEEKGFRPFDFKPMEDEAKRYIQQDGKEIKIRFAEKISFETGKFELKPEADTTLSMAIRLINYNPNVKCRIEGHTDNVGSAKDNLTLSQNRADAVAVALKNRGIPASVKMEVKAYGMSKPIASNATTEGKAQNRRVDIVIEKIKE